MCKGLRRTIQAESVLANSTPAKASSSRNFSLGINQVLRLRRLGDLFRSSTWWWSITSESHISHLSHTNFCPAISHNHDFGRHSYISSSNGSVSSDLTCHSRAMRPRTRSGNQRQTWVFRLPRRKRSRCVQVLYRNHESRRDAFHRCLFSLIYGSVTERLRWFHQCT